MKLTKNTNKVRVEIGDMIEEYTRQSDWKWVMTKGAARGRVLEHKTFQHRISRDDQMGFKIFDISEDEEDEG